MYNNEENVLKLMHIFCYVAHSGNYNMLHLLLLYSDDFYDGSIPQWKFDVNKVGGGIVMDGAIHWIRPLRLL